MQWIREAPLKFTQEAFPVRGAGAGVSTLARLVWGNFFGRDLLDFLGGSRPLPGWFGALFLETKCPRVAV